AYLRQLRRAVPVSSSRQRLRTAWFPVEFTTKDRVFYYLAYVTHHVKGVIVFLEESEKAASYQQLVKFIVHQQDRELRTGITDFFGDEIQSAHKKTDHDRTDQARSLWLELLSSPGNEVTVDEA